MPPKRKNKLSAKKATSVPEVEPTETPQPEPQEKEPGPPADPEPDQQPEPHPEPQPDLEPVEINQSDGGDDEDVRSQDVRPKSKRVYNNFTDRQEELLVEWLRDNPFMYNKCLKEYTNKEKKAAMWTEMAFNLDIPEAQLHKWYKTMRTQFGKLIIRKSGDGARDYTDREKWVLSSFAFLKSHIVRVASRQIGLQKSKLISTSSSTAAPPSDESEMEEETPIDQESGEGPAPSSSAASTTPIPPPLKKQKKKEEAPHDKELQELIDKLTERVENSRDMRNKVTEMIKVMGNSHTAYANYLASMHPSIHPDLWEDYLKKSHENLMFYVTESKRIRRIEEQQKLQRQIQTQVPRYGSTYTQLQSMVVQPQQSGHGTRAQLGSSGDKWDTGAPTYGNPVSSSFNEGNTSQFSIGSFVRQMEEIGSTQQSADPQKASQQKQQQQY